MMSGLTLLTKGYLAALLALGLEEGKLPTPPMCMIAMHGVEVVARSCDHYRPKLCKNLADELNEKKATKVDDETAVVRFYCIPNPDYKGTKVSKR